MPSWRRTSAPTSTASPRTSTTSSSTSITAPPSAQMVKNNRLAPILNQYKELELGPDKLSPLEMGYIYEELLRRFSEQSGEEAGEHFTPREVIRLMVELLDIPIPDTALLHLRSRLRHGRHAVRRQGALARPRRHSRRKSERVEKFVTVHGQELSPTNYAICQADLLIKNDQQAKVHLGNSLIPHDPHSREPGDQLPEPKYRFDFMLSATRPSASPGAARTATRTRRAS